MQVTRAGGPFELVERGIPEPGPWQVRIRVEACGICHSDAFIKEAHFPGLQLPRVPGHEVAGRVDAVGPEVTDYRTGDRVGVGWHGGHCFTCEPCRRGDFINCTNAQIAGISYDGGYADFMVAPTSALARIPDGYDAVKAAPLLCAGVTTYNALRNSGALPGQLVAISGIGGLGHLGVQFASRLGFRTVAITGGSDKADLARRLGAHEVIDTSREEPAARLRQMGGARVILATAPSGKAVTDLFEGLGPNGRVVVVGASMEPIEVSPMQLLVGRRALMGWASGTARDSQDTMEQAHLSGIEPMIETFPLERANEAYERMITNAARFRVVLTMGR
jgi:alcohol dehydrogenase/propanol-preferring alcohol dehydrogenase